MDRKQEMFQKLAFRALASGTGSGFVPDRGFASVAPKLSVSPSCSSWGKPSSPFFEKVCLPGMVHAYSFGAYAKSLTDEFHFTLSATIASSPFWFSAMDLSDDLP